MATRDEIKALVNSALKALDAEDVVVLFVQRDHLKLATSKMCEHRFYDLLSEACSMVKEEYPDCDDRHAHDDDQSVH